MNQLITLIWQSVRMLKMCTIAKRRSGIVVPIDGASIIINLKLAKYLIANSGTEISEHPTIIIASKKYFVMIILSGFANHQ